jgi:metallo-beta-lactamase family protein
MSVSVRFLGGVRTVTGSSHLVSCGASRILLDCGLFQGRREDFYRLNSTFNYKARDIDALVISHAHIDHCGNLPSLIKQGMRGKMYCTHATRDLVRLMLEDSGKIQEEDIRYLNKINKRMGLPLRKPLYTRNEAINAGRRRFQTVSYGQHSQVTKDVSVTLYDAGHILGSAIVVLDVKDAGRQMRIGYAVDLGRKDLPMLNDPVIPQGLDYLIVESTYGSKEHAPIGQAKEKLADVINRTVARQGKIIIPAFTLERTQEVIYFLSQLSREKAIPIVPVYVDSPLATEITEVFRYHDDYMNDATRRQISDGSGPFELLNLRFVRDQLESKALNMDRRPMIIIAGSGMCESGRVLHHLKNTIEDSRNTVLVVGYMAKDTLGRRIVERAPFVRIFGVEYELNAEVAIINSFSGHADMHDLYEFVIGCLPLKRIFLVHGDEEQTWAIFNRLLNAGFNVYMPHREEEVELA